MDGRDAELLSDSLYEATGLDPEVEPGALRLLVRLPFIQHDFIEDLAPRSALIVRHGSYVVCVRESLALRDVEWACGHELAHAFGNTVHGGADYDRVERRCNRIAAALIAPRAAMVVLRDAYGYDLARFGGTRLRLQSGGSRYSDPPRP